MEYSNSKMFIVGDLNFPDLSVTHWNIGQGTQNLNQAFLDMFYNMCLEQCLEQATHRHDSKISN
jgi:hypothetical protein